ncbi:MAG: molybdopterin-dependent oxidoreductase [Chloroflexota bacterium]
MAAGRIKALYVMAADPVGDGLLAGRGQLDLLVVQELFMTETAVLADVVLPAQSWAEREGTFTSGERRVQRYYPAVTPVGESRPDWQILAQLGERLGLGKPAFAASLVFRDISKAVKSYKGMDYRTLAQVVQQWPMVSDEALYYGGTAFENRSGLGQQCPLTPPKEPFVVPEVDEMVPNGLALLRAAALYTPGSLNKYSPIIAKRLARPTLFVQNADAAKLGLAMGDMAQVGVNGTAVSAQVRVDNMLPAGVAVLRGVPYWPGTAVADITKIEQ